MECPNKRILCECVDTKIGLISVVGKHEPVFILELNAIDSGRTVIKYLNCKSSTNGRYTVAHNSDFAKLYRLTLGTNPTKRFSEAKHLLSHFLESQFYVDYEPATGSGGKHYLKATHIEPKTACMGEEWTASGALKKARKKGKKPPPELPDKYRTSTGQVPDKHRIFTGFLPDKYRTRKRWRTLKHLVSSLFSIPLKSFPSKVKPLNH